MKGTRVIFVLVFSFSIMVIVSSTFTDLILVSSASAVSAMYSYQPSDIGNTHKLFNQIISPQQQFMQLRQNFANIEQQLTTSNPQQQQFMIANVQRGLSQIITQTSPADRSPFINLVQQAMSPGLAQIILYPVVAQLQSGDIASGEQSGSIAGSNNRYLTPMQPGDNAGSGQIDPKLMEACLKGEMAVSGNTYEYCLRILNPSNTPAKAAGICGYLDRVNVPVPGC